MISNQAMKITEILSKNIINNWEKVEKILPDIKSFVDEIHEVVVTKKEEKEIDSPDAQLTVIKKEYIEIKYKAHITPKLYYLNIATLIT